MTYLSYNQTRMTFCKSSEKVVVKRQSVQNGWKRARERRVETARVGAAEVVKCVPHVHKRVRGFSSQWADEWLERGMEKKE